MAIRFSKNHTLEMGYNGVHTRNLTSQKKAGNEFLSGPIS